MPVLPLIADSQSDRACLHNRRVLDGTGRAIESKHATRCTIDTLKLARILNCDRFDPVFRFEPATPSE